MTTTNAPYRIRPLPAEVLDRARADRVDAAGIPVEFLGAEGGEPLRCCLRDARPGERLMLFGYRPPLPASPYREVGAVLAHAEPCPGPAGSDPYPPDWYGRPQVLRAYDRRGWIHDATRVHDGRDPAAVIDEMLADPAVARIHSRNVAWGCYMFEILRTG